MYLLFVPYTDLSAAEGISAFQTSFLLNTIFQNVSAIISSHSHSGKLRDIA